VKKVPLFSKTTVLLTESPKTILIILNIVLGLKKSHTLNMQNCKSNGTLRLKEVSIQVFYNKKKDLVDL